MSSRPEKALVRAMAAVALLAALACAPVLRAEFTNWDDPDYVTRNAAVRTFDLAELVAGFHVATFAPLTMLTYAVDHALFGEAPAGFHATNLFLHAAASAAACWLAFLLLGRVDAALVTAALFAVHPLHVEPVAWISGRKELLAALFVLLALGAYERHRAQAGPRWYGLALVFQLLALLSKGTAVTLPLLLFALAWWKDHRRPDARAVRELVPFAALSAAFAAIAWAGQSSAGAIGKIEGLGATGPALVACRGLVFYLAKLVVPFGLSAYYPYPPGALDPTFTLAPPAVAALAAGVFFAARRAPLVAVASCLFVIPLLPVLQAIPLGTAVTADRYAYLPLFGPLLLAGAAFARVPAPRAVSARVAFGALVAVLGVLAFVRCGAWRSSESLWSDVLARHPHADLALVNRAQARTDAGDREGAQSDLRALTALTPRSADGWNNRGSAFYRLGDEARARADFERALRLAPDHPAATLNRGLALARAGDLAAAAADLERAARLAPRDATPLVKRGLVMLGLQRPDEAIVDFTAALARDSLLVEALVNRAVALAGRGDLQAALADLDRAAAAAPGDAQVAYTRGLVRARAGRRDDARAEFRRALSIDPSHAGAQAALAQLGP